MHYSLTMLIGNLGDVPRIRELTNGSTVFNFRMATGDEWHSVEYYAKTPQSVDYLRDKLTTGVLVFVTGEIKTDSWTDRETRQKRSAKKIRAYRVEVLRESLRQTHTLDAEPEVPGEPDDGIPPEFDDEPQGRQYAPSQPPVRAPDASSPRAASPPAPSAQPQTQRSAPAAQTPPSGQLPAVPEGSFTGLTW